VIFDHCPDTEFFVEESFPMDWMYTYLQPYGMYMRVNRTQFPGFTEEMLGKDHDFWKQYSKRFTGDIIDYDTKVETVTQWAEQVYLHRNFKNFTGDRAFLRDDDAQKAFSKLRSAIGGIYAFRLRPDCPAEYRPKNKEEYDRLYKEACFAFLQSYAFCPYSPEAVVRYLNLLMNPNPFAPPDALEQAKRLDDALALINTCLKMDPYNDQIKGILDNLTGIKQQQMQFQQQLQQKLQQQTTQAVPVPQPKK